MEYISKGFGMRHAPAYCIDELLRYFVTKKENDRMEEIMTPSEVAALLKIHLKTVYKLAERGVIPGNRIGRSWRFSRTDVLELVSTKSMSLTDNSEVSLRAAAGGAK